MIVVWILLDEEEIISQAHPNLKEIEHNMGGGEKTSKWGERIWERCGPKLFGYFLMLPILQSQILICLSNILARDLFLYQCALHVY